jgi:hypothetical protein
MKRLSITRPARIQIMEMLSDGAQLGVDLTGEAMGDKCTALAFGQWLQESFQVPVTFIESKNGRTPFMLSDYQLRPRLRVVQIENSEHEYLDAMKSGLVDTMWVFNAWLGARREHGDLFIPGGAPERTDEIIVVPLSKTPYDVRRDMDLEYMSRFVKLLREIYKVTVLYDKPSSYFPDAEKLEIGDFVRRIASAQLVIAGDTGASHLAAVLKTPLISLYPDWVQAGHRKMTQTIAVCEFWGIPATFTPHSTFPNAVPEKFRLSRLDEERRFSMAHVLSNIKELIG